MQRRCAASRIENERLAAKFAAAGIKRPPARCRPAAAAQASLRSSKVVLQRPAVRPQPTSSSRHQPNIEAPGFGAGGGVSTSRARRCLRDPAGPAQRNSPPASNSLTAAAVMARRIVKSPGLCEPCRDLRLSTSDIHSGSFGCGDSRHRLATSPQITAHSASMMALADGISRVIVDSTH